MDQGGGRVVWVDWLKVLVVIGIFAYHVALVFSLTPWVIQNAQRSLVLTALAGWGYVWGIQLLFLLAGAAAWFSLRSRGAGRFLRERFTRLLVPLVAGLIVLSPVQAYFQALNRFRFQGSFLEYLALYVPRIRFSLSPHWLAVYGFHLWFLGFLFLVSVIALPVIWFLCRPGAGAAAVRALGKALSNPAALLLFALPVGALQALLRPFFPNSPDWPDLIACLVFFVFGFLLMANPRVKAVALRSTRLSLEIGALGGIGLGLTLLAGVLGSQFNHPTWAVSRFAYEMLNSVTTWAWVLLLLSLAMRYLKRDLPRLREASAATLPFYVIHHPIVVVIAYFVVQLPVGVWLKFFLILGAGFAITVAILYVLVLPFRPLRFVFGLGPPPAGAPQLRGRLRAAGVGAAPGA